jgi:alkaline phosphatase D
MRRIALTLLFFWLPLPAGGAGAAEPVLSRIAFGSCAKQDQPQPIWDAIVDTQPQLFLFLGDNIYADTQDLQVMRDKYRLLGEQPGYRKLKQSCPVLATWDDHDYGVDDGGADYPMKRQAQQLFLDFFEVPQDDPRRTRDGVYSARVVGPPGKRVQILLLDTRCFRSPLRTGLQPGERGEGRRGKYLPQTDPASTMLGEAQWRWLEEQLKLPAELRIIGSSIQVLAEEHGFEKWANLPHERQRLLRLIKGTRASGVVLLSGDRHMAEIARLPVEHPLGVGYPLYDITSSSLNSPSNNLTKAGTRFVSEVNSHRVGLAYFEVNFGTIHIDWDQPDPVVRAQVRDEKGDVVLQQRLSLSALKAR